MPDPTSATSRPAPATDLADLDMTDGLQYLQRASRVIRRQLGQVDEARQTQARLRQELIDKQHHLTQAQAELQRQKTEVEAARRRAAQQHEQVEKQRRDLEPQLRKLAEQHAQAEAE